MRQTVAVGIIKSVEKTDKSGGKGKLNSSGIYIHLLNINALSSDEVR